MKKFLAFAIPFIFTLLATRIFLHYFISINISFLKYHIPHLFLGIILLFSALPFLLFNFSYKIKTYAIAFTGIATAFIIDEYAFLVFTNGTDPAYIGSVSVYGMILSALFLLSYYLIISLLKK